MEVKQDFETYLFLSKNKISISVFEIETLKNIYFEEKDYDVIENNSEFENLKNFLDENILKIEINFKKFVKKINLILENNEFLKVQLSIKKDNYTNEISKDQLVYLLSEAKDDCKKTINNNKIIHMIIDNYFIDNNIYSTIPDNLKCNLFSLDISFICLSEKLINEIEKIFKNYQISINYIQHSDYVKSFLKSENDDIFLMSMKLINGYNVNEVLIVPKISKNKGFFERFFNLFS